MKKLARKILPQKIWKILSFTKHYLCLPTLQRWNARRFIDCETVFKPTYSGKGQDISRSQYGQELFIFEELFNEGKTNKVFVEVGANDPIELSNTYYLEKMGWTGIAFEPITYLCNKWELMCTTKCFPYVIGDEETWIDFEELEGDQSTMSSVAGYGRMDFPHSYTTVKKQMRKLENVLIENSIGNVDVLFVDVEGFELEVIKGIDFEKVDIRCICIEAPPFTRATYSLRDYICNKGYVLKAHIGGDDIFMGRS